MDLSDHLQETDLEANFIKTVKRFLNSDAAAKKGPFIRVSVSKDTLIIHPTRWIVPSLRANFLWSLTGRNWAIHTAFDSVTWSTISSWVFVIGAIPNT